MWIYDGIIGKSEQPDIFQQCKGSLLVMGSARCLWDDLARFDHIHSGERMSVNWSSFSYKGKIDHICSVHSDIIHLIKGYHDYKLRNIDGPPVCRTHGQHNIPGVDIVWDIEDGGGSSSLFGVLVGLCLGFTKIVLAGVPLDNSGHYFDPPISCGDDFSARHVMHAWRNKIDNSFKDRVRSLSGNTRKWLGEPTEAWLNG